MNGRILVSLIACFTLPSDSTGARILAVLPVFAKSHHMFFQPVLKALANAGHDVVVYSPFPLNNPIGNYTDVIMTNVSPENKDATQVFLSFREIPPWKCMEFAYETLDKVFADFTESCEIQELLSSKDRFDVVFTEVSVSQEFTLMLGHIFKSPVIGLQAFVSNSVVNSVFGNTLSLPFIPDVCTTFPNKMSFVERALNSMFVLRGLYYVYYQEYLPFVEKRFRGYFPDAPPLVDMVHNMSLIFINDHPTADYIRPRTPNIISVAGIHIEDEKQLPEPIKTFMDEATDGVILFSLGTYVRDDLNTRQYFDMYIEVFKQLKQRVLWKTRKDNIEGLPNNVMLMKWAPQRDVLAHPNCVLFITHGGLLSQHETIHCGVPVVVIPQFGDQHRNGRFYQEQGVGVHLDHRALTEGNILSAIRTVLDNSDYKVNMKRLSRIFKDRPTTPAQTVVYWTEYVLRHGSSHLRPASTQLFWYQLALLDVIAVILVALLSLILFIYVIIQKLMSIFG